MRHDLQVISVVNRTWLSRGVDSAEHFITANEQSESNTDCNFHSSIAHFPSGRSYHQNLF